VSQKYPHPKARGGRYWADMVASGLRGMVVPPHFFGLGWPTSTRRRWAQLVGVKMRRELPHPRPWEGPRWPFEGLFRTTAEPMLTSSWLGP